MLKKSTSHQKRLDQYVNTFNYFSLLVLKFLIRFFFVLQQKKFGKIYIFLSDLDIEHHVLN